MFDRNHSARLGAIYWILIVFLSVASIVTTYSGALWLMGGQDLLHRFGAVCLTIGIQSAIVFGSMIVTSAVKSFRRQSIIISAMLLSVGSFVALFGVTLSAATSYVSYHAFINSDHLESISQAGIEFLERSYQVAHREYVHGSTARITQVLDEAMKLFGFWDGERNLQDSRSSPDGKAKGPRWVFANSMAEVYADFIERLTGKRPVGSQSLTVSAGAQAVNGSPLKEFQAVIEAIPQKLSLFDKVKDIKNPVDRYRVAYRIYSLQMDALSAAYAKLPGEEVLTLPAEREEFVPKQLGDRVRLFLDGEWVSDVPVPPKPTAGASEMPHPPATPASYELLKDAIVEYRKAAGDNDGRTVAEAEILSLLEHPWLTAFLRLKNPSVVEYVTFTPAVLVDLGVLIASFVYGLWLATERDRDPSSWIGEMEDQFSRYVEEIERTLAEDRDQAESAPNGGGSVA